ncbi:hypothetical protein [Lacihabitans sp. LS3-19]|uniref:hypothetical protein n=1 Tax=Lacihabitans sp. LS3-19 TaxID=2487335 RepID=UPI0020CE36B1|nr:hypothetical protein [Lacihabitans sp. LS3-19]
MEQINHESFKKFRGSEINSLEQIKGGSDSYEMVGCGSSSSVGGGAYERSDTKILGITIWGRWKPME